MGMVSINPVLHFKRLFRGYGPHPKDINGIKGVHYKKVPFT